ncbi:Antibiotic biosynthesis monooxygenase (ABM) superfamily enzyme [Pseudonocardia ammonioxydans]|uniref:Antibiotic biosynthesis monooxygenase (ABM) superfamily enzyme n=1 Tax=Pseudonocardia ammonioxydans TaxID=260086 RepID=A0A1I5I3G3_PSUAM|nr:hypothetical protein [Pseudonocardia ammonioxydans]SFO55134.1 Antibiotic biosynthesis monooxygenase (ABM) superfamily enzyme [Pseudonocardia ammonioxydans]
MTPVVAPDPLPVSVLTARTARGPGGALTDWAQDLCRAAATMPGHLATHIGEESADGRTTVHVGVTFASAEDLLRWERSPARKHLLDEVAALAEGEPRTFSVDGLHQWTPRGPSKLRTTLLIWIALFPIALLMNLLVMPLLEEWPVAARTLLLTAVLVPGVVLGTLPLLTALLAAWRGRPR